MMHAHRSACTDAPSGPQGPWSLCHSQALAAWGPPLLLSPAAKLNTLAVHPNHWQGVEGFAIVMELLLICLCFQLKRCIGPQAGTAGQQRRRLLLRTLLVAFVRTSAVIVVPQLVDLVRAMAPGLSPHADGSSSGVGSSGGGSAAGLLTSCSGAAGAVACAASVAAHLRGLVMLLLPVAWVHALLGAAIGWQLPPVESALLQSIAVALLLRRAPAGGWVGCMTGP